MRWQLNTLTLSFYNFSQNVSCIHAYFALFLLHDFIEILFANDNIKNVSLIGAYEWIILFCDLSTLNWAKVSKLSKGAEEVGQEDRRKEYDQSQRLLGCEEKFADYASRMVITVIHAKKYG